MVEIIKGSTEALDEEVSPADIPDIPQNRIVYADGYGNLKTTIEAGTVEIQSGAAVRVHVGQVELEATASDGSFEVEEGELAFAPGSSGWKEPDGAEILWIELFLRGGSAREAFSNPPIGASVEVVRA
jgi:S-adenosylmethionine hydrolase